MYLYYKLYNIIFKKAKYYNIINDNSMLIYKVKSVNGIKYKQVGGNYWVTVRSDDLLVEI